MKTLLVLGLLALAFVAAAPVASASHGCVGTTSVAAVCGFHHGGYECYSFWVLGQHQDRMDTC